MEKKQTAIDSLIKRFNDSLDKEPINPTQQEIGYSKALVHFIILLKEAKQMEKEQIINAIDAGHRSTYSICEEGCAANMFGLRMDESAEQYYNETYGNANNKRN